MWNLVVLVSKSKFCYLEHVLLKDSMFPALPPLLWAIWALLVLGTLIPWWTAMSAWVSSIHGVRPQGDGHTADGSQRGAKVTSSSLHPLEASSFSTAAGLCKRVCVFVCMCGGHVLAGSHLSTMRTGKGRTSNYVGWHNRWYLIHLWNYIVNALHITTKDHFCFPSVHYFTFFYFAHLSNTTLLGKVHMLHQLPL